MDKKSKLYTSLEVSKKLELSVRQIQKQGSAYNLGEMYGKTRLYSEDDIEFIKTRIGQRGKNFKSNGGING